MIKTSRVIIALLPLCLLPMPVQADSDPHLTAQQLKQLRRNIDDIQQQLTRMRGEADRTEQLLRKTELRIDRLTRSIRKLDGEIRQQQDELESIGRKMGQERRNLQQNREELTEQVRAAYISGQEAYLKMLLNQRDPQVLGRMLVYYDYVNRARADEIGKARDALTELRELNRRQQQAQERLQGLRTRHESERVELGEKRSQRKQLLAELSTEIEDKEVELARLRADESRLQRLLNDLTTALSDIPTVPDQQAPFASLKGRLSWPLQGRIEAGYGSKRSRNLRWKGVVLDGPEGAEVRAISHGRVAFSDWLRGYGLLTIIDHGDGYMSLYGQNQSLYKNTGDWVSRDEVIARAGETDTERGRLYFEIRHRGQPVDPARWCRR
ncbi:MAG: peptidoglycan DD-metalloendopeptidase family protein [Gammaproteobacteria bacterium]|nr:peptidoglycan DD-metalloendopeptidase family protein [Gammaproteobacteria bacterium]